MNWSDEHYVKLYTRETVTWASWSWQTRTTFMHMMRVISKAGVLDIGNRAPAVAVAMIVRLPLEVTTPALEQLLGDGTIEHVDSALIIPKFNDAQEARKTNAQSKREQREKEKESRRSAQIAAIREAERQTPADTGRSGHPPSPAQPVPSPSPERSPRSRKRDAAPDPRHQPLVKALVDAFPGYAFGGRDAIAVSRLLSKAEPAEVLARWRRALARSDFPKVRAIFELEVQWNHFGQDTPTGRNDVTEADRRAHATEVGRLEAP